MKYKALNPELFQLNRRRFIREMKPHTIAIFNANDLMPRSGDQFFPFRQNAGLFYLSGIDQEETMLVLYPDCPKENCRELLLIKRTNEHIAVWDGHKYTKEEARAASGISKVLFLDEAEALLHELILLSEGICLNINENDRFSSPVETRDQRYAASLRQRYPAHSLYRAQPILKKLQMIKSPYEVEILQHCADVTGLAFRRVMEFVKPGVWEYEVEAEIIHEFIRNRCTGHAYMPIVASGKNACVLHYVENTQQCQDGELLLLDFGCDYANYAADMTRTIPVNGTFTKRQRAVYNAVHRVLEEAKAMLVPGNTLDEYNWEVGKIMTSELIGLGLLSRDAVEKQDPEKPLYKKYFMHGTSHHLGLDVHDLGLRYEPFRAGMVFTCEPGIYIPEENMGVRLENDILITDEIPHDLFAQVPIDAEEIEELMHAGVLG
ncbi:MAG: aminopeptidase P N-terminal domain-containing protein [Saprospiraceae bacterium]|nr:aminopeptidase P N-terminal domain-containing protein [Saprospiraceae bacterium]